MRRKLLQLGIQVPLVEGQVVQLEALDPGEALVLLDVLLELLHFQFNLEGLQRAL